MKKVSYLSQRDNVTVAPYASHIRNTFMDSQQHVYQQLCACCMFRTSLCETLIPVCRIFAKPGRIFTSNTTKVSTCCFDVGKVYASVLELYIVLP